MARKILITGCGSSGTGYTAKCLRAAGLHVLHERAGRDGTASWYLAPGPEHDHYEFMVNGQTYPLPPRLAARWVDLGPDPVILHQTRHPLKVISTMQRFGRDSWRLIYRVCEDIDSTQPLILRCMLYWLFWNGYAEKRACWRYRVEDLVEVWPTICQWLERPALTVRREAVARVSTRTNSQPSRYEPLTWGDLRRHSFGIMQAIRELGAYYGYEV